MLFSSLNIPNKCVARACCWCALILFPVTSGVLNAEVDRKPNVVVFLVDDLGYDDVGGSGNTLVETPVLDQLKNESCSFDHFSVAPACSPTRASFLTGRDFWKAGITHVHGGGDYLHQDELTIADVLKTNGYRTGIWGKWHSGKSPGYFPNDRGFDEAFHSALYKHEHAHGLFNGEFQQTEKWSPELITDYAIDFIKKENNQTQPFFAVISFLAVHGPIEAPQQKVDLFLNEGCSPHLATVYAMVKSVDEQIGRVLQTLETIGVDEDTIVIFFSDNGPINASKGTTLGPWPEEDWKARNQWHQLHGAKGQIWENGIRVPLYIKQADAFSGVNHLPVNVTDLFPTIIGLTDSEMPEGVRPLDGKSLVPLLRGGEESSFQTRSIVGHAIHPRNRSGASIGYRPVDTNHPEDYPFEMQGMFIKKGKFKLLLNPDGSSKVKGPQWHLYDLESDLQERVECQQDHPEIVAELQAELKQWYAELWQTEGLFERSVYQIGANDSGRSKINAFGPAELLGEATNCDHYLDDLQFPGDGARWNVDVKTAGKYILEIEHRDDLFPADLCLLVSIGKNEKQFIIGNNKKIYGGEWDLSEGPQTLKIEVLTNRTIPSGSLDMIRHFTFFDPSKPRDYTWYPW